MNRKRKSNSSNSDISTLSKKRKESSTENDSVIKTKRVKPHSSKGQKNPKINIQLDLDYSQYEGDCKYENEQNKCEINIKSLLSSISGVPLNIAENFVKLIEEENTLPFIARYRKSMVDNMTPESLQNLHDCYVNLCNMKKKANTIINNLQKSGKLTDDLLKSINLARCQEDLDLLYEPLKDRSGSLAERARALGLETVGQDILKGISVNISSLCDNSIDGLRTYDEVEMNLIHLLADIIYKDSRVLEKIRLLKQQTVIYIESSKSTSRAKSNKTESSSSSSKVDADKYSLYFNFKIKMDYIKPHQVLALNRGESVKVLSVKINIPDWFYNNLERFCLSIWRGPLICKAVSDAYKRLIKPWLTRKVRSELTSKAEKESVAVFASNLKRLLMTAPIKEHTILGIDPGFKAGCKIGIVSPSGQALDTSVIYPKFVVNTSTDKEVAKLKCLIDKHKCDVIALGNGTGCRETELWLKKWNIVSDSIPLVIVPEHGASIYSCSSEAIKEHPGMDPNLISALSIARRALDPLSELIKVEPKHIGVGLYQHDISPKLLNDSLNTTVIYCASFVGANLNTASVTLLRKISGLTENKAKAIVKYREENGLFESRQDLLKVSGIGPKVFKQCIGFLRVPQSHNKLDNTWIHPESYDTALKLLRELKLSPSDLATPKFLKEFHLKTSGLCRMSLSSKLKCSENDVDIIIEAISQAPSDDPLRNNKPIYSMSINNIQQAQKGSVLIGVVNNVTPFGCFVDCGIGRDGLIHTSQMGSYATPQVGERVRVKLISQPTDKIQLQLLEIIS